MTGVGKAGRETGPTQQSLLDPVEVALGREGVFGWFSYVQDFDGEFAVRWLERLREHGSTVWEPFSGSGTTLVAGKLLGVRVHGFDVNPFMAWVASTKLNWNLDPDDLRSLADWVQERYQLLTPPEASGPVTAAWEDYPAILAASPAVAYPPDKKLEKWISPEVLARTSHLLSAIEAVDDASSRDFFRLAAASLLVGISNVKFQPNICYKSRPFTDVPLSMWFLERVAAMTHDLEEVRGRGKGQASVAVGDSRTVGPERADAILTSPPYPNDMEYIHQTRLELSILGFISEQADLTRLKKQMISSSVKLVYRENEWQKELGLQLPGVREVFTTIAETLKGRNWGWNAADMVAQYFGGMRTVMGNWAVRLAPGGVAAVVVGDSAFNGVKVETDHLTAEAAEAEGLRVVEVVPFRKRWNTKHTTELRESVVLLRKP